MSAADLRKRLARLEAARAKQKRMQREATAFEVARSVAYVLTCAVERRGGERMREAGVSIARALVCYSQQRLLSATALCPGSNG